MNDGDEAKWARLNAALDRIPEDVKAEITAAHADIGWSCNAASEGQPCCLDYLHAGEKR